MPERIETMSKAQEPALLEWPSMKRQCEPKHTPPINIEIVCNYGPGHSARAVQCIVEKYFLR